MYFHFFNDFRISVLPSSVEIIEPDQNIIEKKTVKFECLVKGANPKPKVVWLKNDVVYSQSLQYVIFIKPTFYSYQ